MEMGVNRELIPTRGRSWRFETHEGKKFGDGTPAPKSSVTRWGLMRQFRLCLHLMAL